MSNIESAPRCQARSRTSGEACRNPAMTGLRVCRNHGGLTPAARDKSLRIKGERAIAKAAPRFVDPIAADDPEASPVTGFEMEYRRTVARIRYLDTLINELGDEDLTFGVTKIEQVGATEFSGTNVTQEARNNGWIALQQWERTHLLAMQKVWITAKLDLHRLELKQREIEMFESAQVRIAAALGHDVNDPKVRLVIQRELAALPVGE